MAKRVIAIPLEPGGPVVLAEVDEESAPVDDTEAFARASSVVDQMEAAGRSVREALDDVIVPAARTIVRALVELEPSEVEVEFGLELSGKLGAIFAEASGDAHVTVKLTWAKTSQQS